MNVLNRQISETDIFFIIILISVVCHTETFLHKHFPLEMIIKVIKVFVMICKEAIPS